MGKTIVRNDERLTRTKQRTMRQPVTAKDTLSLGRARLLEWTESIQYGKGSARRIVYASAAASTSIHSQSRLSKNGKLIFGT